MHAFLKPVRHSQRRGFRLLHPVENAGTASRLGSTRPALRRETLAETVRAKVSYLGINTPDEV